jgi:hypothetical protein
MLYETTRFTSMAVALRVLERIIKSGALIETGRRLKEVGLLPRELVANWLICAAVNSEDDAGERMAFHSDPIDGDGILVDTKSNETWPTEHVLVPMPRTP